MLMPTLDLNTYTFSGAGTYAPGGGYPRDMSPALNLTANSVVSIVPPPPLPVAPPPPTIPCHTVCMMHPTRKKNLIYLQRKWGYWAAPNMGCTGDSAEDTTHFIPDFATIIGAVSIDLAGLLIGVMARVMCAISAAAAVVMPASQAAEGTSKMRQMPH
ncbi:hypothetical protein FB451DRAFT_1184779 [Mycena latifolia]|nr:hypothetical protein FB451DRAFT_1184779 [Mycena latifolia]